jgi:fructokinase
MATVVSIGEVVWDIFPSGEYLGGAPFNFAVNCSRLGHKALFISAVGKDELGSRTLDAMTESKLITDYVRQVGQAGTGTVHVQFDAAGQPHYTIDRPAAYDFLAVSDNTIQSIARHRPRFLYFGTLSQLYTENRTALTKLINAFPEALRFCDVNLRKESFDRALLEQLLPFANVVKMNNEEADLIKEVFGTDESTLEEFCGAYCRKFGWQAVWITR